MSTAALAADALAARQAPEAAPDARPRRRPRIAGTTTERLPVRACSGDDLGRARTAQVAERPQTRRAAVAEAPLRLTRRGRMLLTALSVLVFGSAVVVLGLRVAGVLEPGPDFTHTVPVQVAPGQSLWSIAQETNPAQDPAIVVERIADLNRLAGPADVVPGQTLQVPVAR
ncbi:LysM domain-containing protein [Kribbella turkmenica]|uniref:LysM domain-containing protein n=1 Tax=Kribbella turkmenica TaxID=2530375 RepID=A0A4R4X190_9ACTN|nr:LysM domain-containing protein [Kribbella turkmenica]TDD23974.1 LysM domain-containing protein [Kribbella turkmenica]